MNWIQVLVEYKSSSHHRGRGGGGKGIAQKNAKLSMLANNSYKNSELPKQASAAACLPLNIG